MRWHLEIGSPKKACVGPLTNREKRRLRGGLYYFVVHSETLHGMRIPLSQTAPMVYRLVE